VAVHVWLISLSPASSAHYVPATRLAAGTHTECLHGGALCAAALPLLPPPPLLPCCRSGWLQQVGAESKHTALVVGLHGTGSDQTAPAPFLRLMLLWLAISQHWKRASTLPPGSLPLQPRTSSQARRTALCAAVQQQLTPSCCFQLLKRLAPAYWAVVTAQQVPPPLQQLVTLSSKDDCGAHMGAWLQDVGAIAIFYDAGGPPCGALGKEAHGCYSCCNRVGRMVGINELCSSAVHQPLHASMPQRCTGCCFWTAASMQCSLAVNCPTPAAVAAAAAAPTVCVVQAPRSCS
jgi:hypothetical protein